LLLACSARVEAHSRAGAVALTIDDVPVSGNFGSVTDAALMTRKLIGGIARNHWPAIGFVNEFQLEAHLSVPRVHGARYLIAL